MNGKGHFNLLVGGDEQQMNESPILISLNALFAIIAVIAYFFRNRYLHRLKRVESAGESHATQSSLEIPTDGEATTEIARLKQKARFAAIVCGVGVVGAAAANLTMQATFGP